MNLVSCLHPKLVRNKFTHELQCVPCGKCSACVTSRQSLWTARLREESACHTYTMFCTLTYDDAHLPTVNVDDYVSQNDLSDDFHQALVDSADTIKYFGGNIPVPSVKDIQGFFKRLRSYIYYNHGTQTNLRYFLASEIGPTTFRPHYHFLLWFDSPDIVPSIKEYIYKAWKSKTCHKSLSSFLRRNKCVFVHGSAERYVAGYINMFAHLPALYSFKPFRPWHVQSSCPPIGTIRILKESLQSLLSGNVSTVSLRRQTSTDVVNVSLWRGLENRYFPKCIGFASLPHADRVSLYNISIYGGLEKSEDFGAFKEWFLPQWFSSVYPFPLVRSLCGDSSQLDFPDSSCIESLHRLFNVSRRVRSLSSSLGVSVSDYVSRIEAYYVRKDYEALKQQIFFQQELADSPRADVGLSYYPFLIDNLFYLNLRSLPSNVFQSYEQQFNLDSSSSFKYVPERSYHYGLKKSFTDKILSENSKVRVKKDYVATHPECISNYLYQLNRFRL